ncbi:MAG TPA: nucleotidyltransferase domain-containing protein [Myxococcota bacterium]|nr:nucleotidyltransferase domain-containing protein [Myxococcota bacterium]
MTDDPTRPESWAVFREAVRRKIARDLEQEGAAAESLRARVLPAVARALAEARAQGLCGEAWLFGSFVWDTPTERSDVDVLVAGCDDAMGLAADVGKAAGCDVHVVRLETAEAGLRERVLRDGRPV